MSKLRTEYFDGRKRKLHEEQTHMFCMFVLFQQICFQGQTHISMNLKQHISKTDLHQDEKFSINSNLE